MADPKSVNLYDFYLTNRIDKLERMKVEILGLTDFSIRLINREIESIYKDLYMFRLLFTSGF
jgi:hypothetical protein